MTSVTLTFKNLTRNRLRTALTIAAIALPLFVFTVARSFVDIVNQTLADSNRQMRVAVHQKLTYTAQLPQRVRKEIEDLAPPGYITAICGTTWFGGHVENTQATFPSMAVHRDTFPAVYSEFGMTPEEIERFTNERRGAVVSPALANRMNWKLGDRVTLVGGIPPFPKMEFVIVAIPQRLDSPWFYFGFDYYHETFEKLTGRPLGVNNFWLKCSSDQARQWALTAIDKHYENSESETRAEMESTFFASFISSGGDWVGLIWSVGRLIVLVAVAVAFNTMSMAFRDRTREIAVMRAVGFPASRIIQMVLFEGAVLGLLGGAIAVVPIYAVTRLTSIEIPGLRGSVHIAGETAFMAISVAVACGLVAALLPAVMAGRLRVAPALRKVV